MQCMCNRGAFLGEKEDMISGKVFVLRVWNFVKLHNKHFFKNFPPKIFMLSACLIGQQPSWQLVQALISSRTSYLEQCLLKRIYCEIIESFSLLQCSVVLEYKRLKGKVWNVHCQIKSCSAATQHLTNETQITVWSRAMSLCWKSLYDPNYSIWREDCAHFLKLKSLQGAAGLIAAGCFTKDFYFVLFYIIQAVRFGAKSKIQQRYFLLIFPQTQINISVLINNIK